MKPNEGRLQTAEHILAKTIQEMLSDAKVSIAKFDKENIGILEISTVSDLREIPKEILAGSVNQVIKKNLPVIKKIIPRVDAQEFDLTRVPLGVNEIRIVDIVGFDKRPCRDPHVDNTSEIGTFHILSIDRCGKDRYRFTFKVE
jgi:Ser-tRNA(Ala) deacylase AlaX